MAPYYYVRLILWPYARGLPDNAQGPLTVVSPYGAHALPATGFSPSLFGWLTAPPCSYAIPDISTEDVRFLVAHHHTHCHGKRPHHQLERHCMLGTQIGMPWRLT